LAGCRGCGMGFDVLGLLIYFGSSFWNLKLSRSR
jgi:hypothetical protein